MTKTTDVDHIGGSARPISFTMASTVLITSSRDFSLESIIRESSDGFSGATPLDQFRYREGLTTEEFWALESVNITPWLWTNVAFLAGGAWLLYRRIISWASSSDAAMSAARLSHSWGVNKSQ